MKTLDLGKLTTSTAERMQLLVDEKGIDLQSKGANHGCRK
jgi:hypothetical protein